MLYFQTKGGNTEKIANEIALELDCESLRITKATSNPASDLDNYDLIIIGTGIHFGNPYNDMIEYLNSLSEKTTKKVAIFVTWGGAGKTNQIVISKLKTILESKNQKVIEDFFNCYGGWKILKKVTPTMKTS